jgi:DNA-binding transcriptional LysR family regulator
MMELRHLRYFQAVGREEHFGRAATRLNVAQPALTRQIRDLERELGVDLFERLPRGVRLSPAGRQFLGEVGDILARVEHAAERARGFATGSLGSVRVGFSELASGDSTVPQRLVDFRSREPNVALNLMPMGSMEQVEAVKAGRLDVAIVYDIHYRAADLEALATQAIGATEIVLAICRDHPFADRRQLRIADLAGEPMLWPRRDLQPAFHDALMARCLAQSVTPRIIQEVQTNSILLSLVSVGMGHGFISASGRDERWGNVALRPVDDLDLTLRLHMLWRKADPSPALKRFVELTGEGA